jgi:isopentenyldiphosphate isomerase
MSDETFDVVDSRDRVVGQALRREVHAKGLLHRAIHVLIFDRKGHVFLQKRSMKKDIAAGLWDSSCSGHVDAGEDYDHACHRELGEELGLHLPAPPARWFRIEACPETGQEFVWVYRLTHEGPFVLHPDEIESGAWYEPGELTAQLAAQPERFASAFRLIWRLLPAAA